MAISKRVRGSKKALRFKSKEAYRKWLAYGHMRVKDFGKAPYPDIYIKGKLHKPKHRR